MRKYSIMFSILFILCNTQMYSKEISIVINPNIETMVVILELAQGTFHTLESPFEQPLREKAKTHFTRYNSHRVLKTTSDLLNRDIGYNIIIELGLHCSSFPNGKLEYEFEDHLYIQISQDSTVENGKFVLNNYISEINDFYKESHMKSFLKENHDFYEGVKKEVKKNLPEKDFIHVMENYYGMENESYTLIPTPILYGTMGFGPRLKTESGVKIYNIFSPIKSVTDSDDNYGFDNVNQIYELSVHEFGHSFVNPITETSEINSEINKYSYLYEPIKNEMAEQRYNNWTTMVNEHVIRLIEIRISLAMNETNRANRLRDYYTIEKDFVYLNLLEKKIYEYENNREKFLSLSEFLPELISVFGIIEMDENNAKYNKYILGGAIQLINIYAHQLQSLEDSKILVKDERVLKFVDNIYVPYKRYFGNFHSKDSFYEWTQNNWERIINNTSVEKNIPFSVDFDSLFSTTANRLYELTGKMPKGKWYLAYGPGFVDMGGFGNSIMFADFFGLGDNGVKDLIESLPHEISHQILGNTSEEEYTLLYRIIDEGLASFTQYVYFDQSQSPAYTIGFTNEEWKWCMDNEKRIFNLAKVHLQTTDHQIINKFAGWGRHIQDDVPDRIAYFIGFRICQAYVNKYGDNSWVDLYDLSTSQILELSAYEDTLTN